MAALAIALTVSAALAQNPDGPRNRDRGNRERAGRAGRQDGQRPDRAARFAQHPLMAVLDADHDGELSAAEIENAATALKKLDQNADGKLTRDELRPPRGRGDRAGRGGADGAGIVERIMSRDENGDGKVTKDEMPERMQRMLERVDTNNDGAIDRAEAERFAERTRDRDGRRGKGRGNADDRPGRGGRR
jgi:Ca2+-binding EF-hand superfamily protein